MNDLTNPGFIQTPACGYALIETRTWTIPAAAPFTTDSTNYIMAVSSKRNLDDGVY